MSKRIIITGIILILAISVIIGFIFLRKNSSLASNPWKVVPVDAVFVLRINNFHGFKNSLSEESIIWKNLSSIPPFSQIEENLHYLDSVAQVNSGFSEVLRKSNILISGHYIGGRKSDLLAIISLPAGYNEKNIVDLISGISNQNLRETQRKHEGKSIYSFNGRAGDVKHSFYLSCFDGNIIISKSVILIENAIRQQSLAKSLMDDKEFSEILYTSGKNKDANLLVDLRKFTGLASIIANEKFGAKLKKYINFGGWAEFDVNIVANQTMLNGFMMSDNSGNNLIDIFTNEDPVKISAYQILPASISTFLTLGINDNKKYTEKYHNYLAASGKKQARESRLNEINNAYKVDLEEVITEILDIEITIAHGGFIERTLNVPAQFVLIKCKSGSQAEKRMESVANQIWSKKGESIQNKKHVYSIDNDLSFKILEFPVENFTGLLFGESFRLEGKNYMAYYGNYLIISPSIEALKHFLYDNILNKTLSTNSAFKNFTNSIAQKSYLLFYTNLSRSSTMFEDFLSTNIIKVWEENYEIFQNIQALGLQITEVSNMKYSNLVIQHVIDYEGRPKTVWESLLDTSFVVKPQLFDNHYTKQKEIFLQDQNNNIYLINKAGRILWKQNMSEKVISEVYQIDYYKNGKLQLLFSTENYLHLIDRFGNYVERYPVRLRERASAGMSLFDYDNNKDYRIFVPCMDNKVYAYSKEGSLINGWKFEGSDYPIKSVISHFRVAEKDFIVISDKYRIWIVDRRGNVRVKVDEVISKSERNRFYLENSENIESSRIVTTDTLGNIISVYFDGRVTTTTIDAFSSNHFFDFKDIDGDGINDFIFLDYNKLRIFSQKRNEIFSFEFPSTIQQRPIYFKFSASDRKLGLIDGYENKIYLLNNDGGLYKGFPLEGTTLFSIGNLDNAEGNFNLIVGGRNNFLYNYSVQ